MAKHDVYLDDFFMHLSEGEKRLVLTLASIVDDRPPILRGLGGGYADAYEWMSRHRSEIAQVIFLATDPPDDEVSLLARDVPIWTEAGSTSPSIDLVVLPIASPANDPAFERNQIPLTDLAVATDVALELFVAIAGANLPLGHIVEPPAVQVSPGSVQFTIGGGLLATGIGLVVACSAGLVAAPMLLGIGAGGLLAGTGVLDLAIGWKKVLADSRLADAQAVKAIAEARQAEANVRKTNAEAEALEFQNAQRSRRFAYSSLIPRTTISDEARKWRVSEQYAQHALNRGLRPLVASLPYAKEVRVKTKAPGS